MGTFLDGLDRGLTRGLTINNMLTYSTHFCCLPGVGLFGFAAPMYTAPFVPFCGCCSFTPTFIPPMTGFCMMM